MLKSTYFKMFLISINSLLPQMSNGLKIILVLKGRIYININNHQFELNTGELILMNSDDVYSIKGEDTNIELILEIPYEYLRKECDEISQHTFVCNSSNNSPQNDYKYLELKRLLIDMMISHSSKKQGYQLKIRANLYLLLDYLLNNFQKESKKNTIHDINNLSNKKISSILSYINEHYREPITLNELARKEFISVHHLSRLFKKQMNIGYLDYINTKRLESAVKDLIFTKESILTIALQNGFTNANAFISAFKKNYQETPNIFRKNYQNHHKNMNNTLSGYKIIPMDKIDSIPNLVEYINLCQNNKNDRCYSHNTHNIIN